MASRIPEARARFSSMAPRAPDVRPGPAFDPWHVRILAPDEFNSLREGGSHFSELQLSYLAWFGTLAPTSHNTVPQRFQLAPDSNQISIWLDRDYVLAESDVNGRQASISCGCAAAYVSLAGQAYGLRTRLQTCEVPLSEVLPKPDEGHRYTEMARVFFEASSNANTDISWLTAMLERKSMRVDYDPRVELGEEVIQEMKYAAAKFPEIRMHLLTDAVTLSMFGKFQEMADTIVYNREPFARELGEWLLQNDDDSPVGMRGAEFGLSDEAALHMHRGLRGEERLLPDEVAAFAKSSNRAIRSASAVVVICVEHDTVGARIASGQAFSELALLLHMHGLSTAMHAAITEVEAPNLALRGRLRTTWRPTVVFRIGQPARITESARPHSARPAISDLLVSGPSKPKP